MGTLVLIIGVAMVAAVAGYALGRHSRQRTRRVFLVGFLCGSVAGSVVRRRLTRLLSVRVPLPVLGARW